MNILRKITLRTRNIPLTKPPDRAIGDWSETDLMLSDPFDLMVKVPQRMGLGKMDEASDRRWEAVMEARRKQCK